MRCSKCKDKGFIYRPKYKIERVIYCSETQTETVEKITLGGTDICPDCQELSEIEYQAQLGDKYGKSKKCIP